MERELNSLRKKYLDQRDPIVHQLQTMVDSFATSQQQILQANQELIQRTINLQMEQYHNAVQVTLFMDFCCFRCIDCLISGSLRVHKCPEFFAVHYIM